LTDPWKKDSSFTYQKARAYAKGRNLVAYSEGEIRTGGNTISGLAPGRGLGSGGAKESHKFEKSRAQTLFELPEGGMPPVKKKAGGRPEGLDGCYKRVRVTSYNSFQKRCTRN